MYALIVRPLSNSLQYYNKLATTWPLITMSLTTGATMGFGSWACQQIKNSKLIKKKAIDFKEIIEYAAFGTFLTGPGLRYWWYTLDLTIFKNRNTFLRPVKMMIVDIATFRLFIIAAFIFYASVTHGKTVKQAIKETEYKIYPVFVEALKVWPVATLVNFYLIPLPLRVLFANAVALGWNTYMAYLVSESVEELDHLHHNKFIHTPTE